MNTRIHRHTQYNSSWFIYSDPMTNKHAVCQWEYALASLCTRLNNSNSEVLQSLIPLLPFYSGTILFPIWLKLMKRTILHYDLSNVCKHTWIQGMFKRGTHGYRQQRMVRSVNLKRWDTFVNVLCFYVTLSYEIKNRSKWSPSDCLWLLQLI